MKKILLFVLIGMAGLSFGQKKEKIKGNKEVLIKKFLLPDFDRIKVGEKFEVELKKAVDTTRVVIETDDNLFDVIHFEVVNKELSFYTTREIVKKKRLRITVYVPSYLNYMEVLEKGKIYNEESLTFHKLEIQAFDRGKTDLILDLKESLQLNAANKTKVNLDITAPFVEIFTNDDAQTGIKASVAQMSILQNDHSNVNIKGDGKEVEINTNDKSRFEGESFVIEKALIIAKDKTKTYINSNKELTIIAKGDSNVFIYNQPEINLKAFEDHAVLYKK